MRSSLHHSSLSACETFVKLPQWLLPLVNPHSICSTLFHMTTADADARVPLTPFGWGLRCQSTCQPRAKYMRMNYKVKRHSETMELRKSPKPYRHQQLVLEPPPANQCQLKPSNCTVRVSWWSKHVPATFDISWPWSCCLEKSRYLGHAFSPYIQLTHPAPFVAQVDRGSSRLWWCCTSQSCRYRLLNHQNSAESYQRNPVAQRRHWN